MLEIINVINVHKSFRVYSDKKHTLKEKLIHFGRSGYTEHHVLKGVDLHIQKGDTVALIGENGSGKSTLLKLMSGIIYPDLGQISMNGKVSSLLELGAGFHPDFSGRENIYNNASIFGLSRKQIENRFEQIVAFSELEEFIDNPVRTYSSGMYMRLAFSVAINVDADILLIDEILSVGDAHFQKKCMNMIRHLKRQGMTIVLVTHDMGAADRISDYTVWLEDGIIRQSGESRMVIDQYLLELERKNNPRAISTAPHEPAQENKASEQAEDHPHPDESSDSFMAKPSENRWGNQSATIENFLVYNNKNESVNLVNSGDPIRIQLDYRINIDVENIVFGIAISNMDGITCVATNSLIRHVDTSSIPRNGSVYVDIHSLNLAEGTYTLDVACHDEDGQPYDFIKDAMTISVFSVTKDAGIYIPEQTWTFPISG